MTPNISVTNISANMVEWQSTDYGDIYGNVPGKTYWFEIDKYDYRQKKQLYALLLKLI